MAPQEQQALETRVAVIENEFSSIYQMSSRFERALDKLTEVSASLKEMLAVHEAKLQEHDKTDTALLKSIADHKSDYEEQVEHLHQRVEKMGDELRQQIKSEIVEYGAIIKEGMADLKLSHHKFIESHQIFVRDLEQRLREINDNHVQRTERLEERLTRLELLKEANDNHVKKTNNLERRLATLERYRWIVIGGIVVLGAVYGKWDVISKFFVG